MKIAIIGAGNVGQALAGSFVRAGHEVSLSARDRDKLAETARRVGATAAASNTEAVKGAEIVVLAVPYATSAEQVSREIAAEAAGKIVIDPTNPVKPTYDGLLTEGGASAAEHVQSWIPDAKVVKAFNTLFASRQADPVVEGTHADGFFATDAADAAAVVAELLDSIGVRPIHVGGLTMARQLEALQWLHIHIQMRYGLDLQAAFKLLGLPEGARLVPEADKRSA